MIEHFGQGERIVRRVVAGLVARYGEYVDEDDLYQEAMLWWYDKGQPHVEEYLAEGPPHTRLRRSIWRHCAEYAEREVAEVQGYHPDDQYRYSAREIARVLPHALGLDFLPATGEHDGGPKPKGNLAEGGDAFATWLDVRRSLSALAESDVDGYVFLVLADDLEYDWDRVATHTGTLADSCRRRYARICERIARWLNNEPEKENAA